MSGIESIALENHELRGEVVRLRALVPGWQPIGFHQIRSGMRVRKTCRGVESTMTVHSRNDFGALWNADGEVLTDQEGAVWHVANSRLPADGPSDPRVERLAEHLEAGEHDCGKAWPSCEFADWFRLVARKLLEELDALATMGGESDG